MVAHKWSGCLAVLGFAGALVTHACGGEQGTPAPGPIIPPSVNPTTTQTDATATGSTPTTPEAPPSGDEDDQDCGGEISGGDVEISANCTNSAPPNCNISSFDPDTYDFIGHEWGNDTQLTGGSFTYQDDANDVQELMRSEGNGALNISGPVPTYAGWGMWFGPCVDASHWEGLEFTIGGALGGEEGQLTVQLQTDENYPIEEGSEPKGACTFTDEATKWDECTNAQVAISGVATEAQTYRIPWAEFSGGKPNDGADPRQLRGVQFQVNCGELETTCDVNLQLHDLRFYKNQEPFLGPMPDDDSTGDTGGTTTGTGTGETGTDTGTATGTGTGETGTDTGTATGTGTGGTGTDTGTATGTDTGTTMTSAAP